MGVHHVPFSDADFRQYLGRGRADIEGSALGRTQGGEAKTCAGYPVYLAPGNAFDQDAVANLGLLSAVDLAAGPALRYWRKTACDAQGRFVFRHVPAGNWIVITSIVYEISAPNFSNPTFANLQATAQEGGLLMRSIEATNGPNDVVLTTDDTHIGNFQF
ncbi:MAG: hypothetical protein ISS15_06765 [Alphaproteobacteria bacterium]|nr:hypothetical protein [Alphaproteobacteria bacterium]MBL7097339.1 hypothetical protein [Alphaproteobacteria bacterium]